MSAFDWTRQAAEQGHSRALYNLGVFYEEGQGTEVNVVKAAKCFRLAAEQGCSDAQYNYGVRPYTVTRDVVLKLIQRKHLSG